jgi:hypothetical protein
MSSVRVTSENVMYFFLKEDYNDDYENSRNIYSSVVHIKWRECFPLSLLGLLAKIKV